MGWGVMCCDGVGGVLCGLGWGGYDGMGWDGTRWSGMGWGA